MELAEITSRVNYNAFISDCMEQPAVLFRTWFSRCCGILYFIACRVLGTEEGAEQVVQNCWIKASCHPPRFEHEGAFRSWLIRILIDEALAVRTRTETWEREYFRLECIGANRM